METGGVLVNIYTCKDSVMLLSLAATGSALSSFKKENLTVQRKEGTQNIHPGGGVHTAQRASTQTFIQAE